VSGSNLVFSLNPHTSYCSPSGKITISNGRGSAPSRTGESVTTLDLLDYDYANIFTWITNNPGVNPPFGFPVTPPSAFWDDGTAYDIYVGSWDVTTGVNDTFLMKIDTPVASPAVVAGWQTVTMAAGTYASISSVVTALQTSVNAVYGSGKVTVSSVGDALKFAISHADHVGEFSHIDLAQDASKPFFSFGSATAGALIGETTPGTGDITFLEKFLISDATAAGTNDLAETIGLVAGALPVGSDGVKYRRDYGESDYNFLRVISAVDTTAYGTLKVPYTLTQIIANINAVYTGYSVVAQKPADFNFLQLYGKIKSKDGKLKIIAYEDPDIPGSKESSEVYSL
jgi:hypothetical protein